MGVHGIHADLGVRAVLGKEVAAHVLGPLEAELVHEALAAEAGARAHGAAGANWPRVRAHADGRVEGAEEELELGGAVEVDERPELVRLQRRRLLARVPQLVGHGRLVVLQALAHGHADGLAPL